jgi:hypothetical protein
VNVSWITSGLSLAALAAGPAPPACVAAKPVVAIVVTAAAVKDKRLANI